MSNLSLKSSLFSVMAVIGLATTAIAATSVLTPASVEAQERLGSIRIINRSSSTIQVTITYRRGLSKTIDIEPGQRHRFGVRTRPNVYFGVKAFNYAQRKYYTEFGATFEYEGQLIEHTYTDRLPPPFLMPSSSD